MRAEREREFFVFLRLSTLERGRKLSRFNVPTSKQGGGRELIETNYGGERRVESGASKK